MRHLKMVAEIEKAKRLAREDMSNSLCDLMVTPPWKIWKRSKIKRAIAEQTIRLDTLRWVLGR